MKMFRRGFETRERERKEQLRSIPTSNGRSDSVRSRSGSAPDAIDSAQERDDFENYSAGLRE